MPLPFFKRTSLAEHARQLRLESYKPVIALPGLLPGVDNLRHDVVLSPRFCEISRAHIARLIERHGRTEDITRDELSGSSAYARPVKTPQPPVPTSSEIASEFKRKLTELQLAALQQAKSTGAPVQDLLFRLALTKFCRNELSVQYRELLERYRSKLHSYGNAYPAKILELRERLQRFQVDRKNILRRAGLELLATLNEVEKEQVASMRRSLFGEQDAPAYGLFLNPLVFVEDGREDHMNAEQYVMFGNFAADVDRFDQIETLVTGFVMSLGFAASEEQADAMLNVPTNAQEMFGEVRGDDSSTKSCAQRALLSAWVDLLAKNNILRRVLASYEVVPLLPDYATVINPQQLKSALISRKDRARVEALLAEHGKLSPEKVNNAAKRITALSRDERTRAAARYMLDFLRYHRDLSRLAALNGALDLLQLMHRGRNSELSRINNTLYEFLLPEEGKPSESRIQGHVILKADIRDSSGLTRSLSERGLNPASYLSLHFYEPVNKLLAKYNATKVFIEGDAVILALFERENEQGFAVARASMMGREIIEIVGAYNKKSQDYGLPPLELGIGISYQDSAPLYLMDGQDRIMISKALNESDRLSSCSRKARLFLAGRKQIFSVFRFQTAEAEDADGALEELGFSYNVGGIHLNVVAFEKLQQELSLSTCDLQLPMPWGTENMRLFRGTVPVAPGVFHRIVVREGAIAQIHEHDFGFERWTSHHFYEVCTNAMVEELVDKTVAMSVSASQ